MKPWFVTTVFVAGCAVFTTSVQPSKQAVKMTLDSCVVLNAPVPGESWHDFIKKKTWFECCIDSCDVACLADDSECLTACQLKCWDGPPGH